MRLIFCVAVLALLSAALGQLAANPFYVDPATIKPTDFSMTFNLKNHKPAASKDELTLGTVLVESLDKRVLHLKVTNTSGARWEASLFNPAPGSRYVKEPLANLGFKLYNDPFAFAIVDPVTQNLMVNTSVARGGSLLYYDKFIELGLWYPSRRIFGVGERITKDLELCSDKKECMYTTFNRDEGCPYDDGTGGKHVYGTQPFYLIHLPSKLFMGVFSLNSNAQDTNVTRLDDGISANVYHKTIGGIVELYFFYPGTAEEVLRKYHDLIGRPYVPPFWSMGFHFCRYSWKTLDAMKNTVAGFEQADIPLETMWADIDYMNKYADFTVDYDKFKGLPEYVKDLHKRKMYWVPIIDAGLKYDVKNKYFKMGEANNAFIKSAWTKTTLIGKVWPGDAVFLSWYAPAAKSVWHEGLKDFHEQAEFDGIWLDMNEVSNFCTGECPDGGVENVTVADATADDANHDPHEFDDLRYYPGKVDPNQKNIGMTGYHYSTNAFEDRVLKEYNTHSLWGTFETRATHQFFTEKLNRRSFTLTRANYPGSGMFTSKWLGDNPGTWDSMRYSIVGIFNYQMFGIPHIGADICGFNGHAGKELCIRWMQLGAFYPFARNHHDYPEIEPYKDSDVALASRNALRQRYSVLRFYHTQLFLAALNGGTVVRPLFFEFPEDDTSYAEAGKTILIGRSVLVVPVLDEGKTTVDAYLPNDDWFSLNSRTRLARKSQTWKAGTRVTLDGSWKLVNLLIRGGSVVPFQDALSAKIRRTETLKHLPLEIIVAPNSVGSATGTLIIDDDASPNPIPEQRYRAYEFGFDMEGKKMTVTMSGNCKNDTPMSFEKVWKITVLGAEKWEKVRSACIYNRKTGQKVKAGATYDSKTKAITFQKTGGVLFWADVEAIRFDDSC